MKDEELDLFIKERISQLSGAPPNVKWDPERTFDNIAQKLDNKKSSGFLWTHATAATVSLLLIGMLVWQFSAFIPGMREDAVTWFSPKNEKEMPPLTTRPLEAGQIQASAHNTSADLAEVERLEMPIEVASFLEAPVVDFPEVEVRPIAMEKKMQRVDLVAEVGEQKSNSIDFAVKTPFTRYHTPKNKTNFHENAFPQRQVSLDAQIGLVSAGSAIGPVLAASINLTNKSGFNMGVGLANYSAFDLGKESASLENTQFLEVSFGQRSNQPGKGGSVGLGYLINTNGDTFDPESTFKVNYSKKVRSKIQITPEVIFTNRFRTVIPGLRVTLG